MEKIENRQDKLYEEAEARVNFKSHAKMYFLINGLIWGAWFFFRGQYGHFDGFWPIYMTLGWGFGLFSHYMGVYRNNQNAIQKEYEKLKRERGLD